MEKYKRYSGILLFLVIILLAIGIAYKIIPPKLDKITSSNSLIKKKEDEYKFKQKSLSIVKDKIENIKNSISTSKKKIYSPIESDLGNDTLFFTLYNDLIEMVHSNSVKIKAINYTHNPQSDAFVKFGKDVYFVCDIDLDLASNYVNLGNLIQNIYQYPYYIKINNISILPYQKDKKILLTKMSLRLYAHTESEEITDLEPVLPKNN